MDNNTIEIIQWISSLVKIPLGIVIFVILASLLVLLILYKKGYSGEKIANFWLRVLMIIFRYREKTDEKRTN